MRRTVLATFLALPLSYAALSGGVPYAYADTTATTVAAPTAQTTATTATATSTSTLTDLAASADIGVEVTGTQDPEFASEEQNYPAPLTGSTGWRGFSHQGGRYIDIHLPQVSTVTSLSIDLRQDLGLGISYPTNVDFQVEQNGLWYKLGTRAPAIPTSDIRDTNQVVQVQLPPTVGQDFRIYIPVSVWVFAREVHVLGTPGVASGAVQPSAVDQPVTATPQGVSGLPMSPSDTRAHGIRNMLLVNASQTSSAYVWSTSDFLPMVEYTPQSGQPTAHMFDSVLFIADSSVPDTSAGWQSYLTNLFAPNVELQALDAAVGQANQTLNTPGYKEKVVLTIPYPAYGAGDFGQVNGSDLNFSGTADDPDATKARAAALDWYVKTLLADWHAANFQNLQLTGLYWESESYQDSSPGEATLLQDATNLAHQNSLPLFWIPFYGASHANAWQATGFDAAWLQPNYAEQGDAADLTRLTNAETEAASYGLGLEVEWTSYDNLGQTNYAQTLRSLQADGFGNSVSHAWYDGSKFLLMAEQSTDPYVRAMYDYTYQFMNNQPLTMPLS